MITSQQTTLTQQHNGRYISFPRPKYLVTYA